MRYVLCYNIILLNGHTVFIWLTRCRNPPIPDIFLGIIPVNIAKIYCIWEQVVRKLNFPIYVAHFILGGNFLKRKVDKWLDPERFNSSVAIDLNLTVRQIDSLVLNGIGESCTWDLISPIYAFNEIHSRWRHTEELYCKQLKNH